MTSRLSYDDPSLQLAPREELAAVAVVRVWSTRFGRFSAGRAIDYLTFYVMSFFALMSIARRGDTILALTDPPLISVAAGLTCRLKACQLINWHQDIFPEVAGALGMRWANRLPGKILAKVRNWSVRQAVINVALHHVMAKRLADIGAPPDSVRVCENWADSDIRPISRENNALRREWGLEGKFVVAYSGNLGRAHMPDLVAKLVALTKDIDDLVWLFIGGGAGIPLVREAAGDAKNVQFRAYQPRERLSESLSAGDAHLVSLDPSCEGLIVPSKLYGVLAVDRPVVFLGSSFGAVAMDVTENPRSLVLNPTAPEEWREAIVHLKRQSREAFGGEGSLRAPSGPSQMASIISAATRRAKLGRAFAV